VPGAPPMTAIAAVIVLCIVTGPPAQNTCEPRSKEYLEIGRRMIDEDIQRRRPPNRDPQGYIYGPSYPYR
jgi:hypothetical protein